MNEIFNTGGTQHLNLLIGAAIADGSRTATVTGKWVIDDGVLVTGNVITAELSLADSDISIGDTYNHLVEKDGVRVSMSANATHGPFDMINYPDITRGNQLAIGPFVFNNSGDFVICFSVGAHLIFGGHFSIGFNVSEYYRRLFD